MSSTAAPALRRVGQSLTTDDLVHLYTVDLTPIGVNQRIDFTSKTNGGQLVSFGGVQFQPLDVKCEGFEMSSEESLPQPTVTISNVTRIMSSASILYDDLLKARFVRTRTYKQFLDGQPMANAMAFYARDIYSFHQKIKHDKREISWRLASAMDQEGIMLPKRVVVRDICLKPYRKWNAATSSFDYTDVECPYAGSKSYDINGNEVPAAQDRPSRHLNTCCRVRFGTNARLPFGGFVGVGRTRI